MVHDLVAFISFHLYAVLYLDSNLVVTKSFHCWMPIDKRITDIKGLQERISQLTIIKGELSNSKCKIYGLELSFISAGYMLDDALSSLESRRTPVQNILKEYFNSNIAENHKIILKISLPINTMFMAY